MKITIVQTTTTIMNEERLIESSSVTENFVIEPEAGKVLKNIKNGQIIRSRVCVNKKAKTADYIEVADPNVLLTVEPFGATSNDK